MKKICVFLMFILFMCCGFSAYATTDIAANAESSECVEDITGTYSGDANFKAKWTPNTVPLRWYNNNTLMQGVNTESNTCNYGNALTIPTTPPERIGYIFDGWKVRPTYDFSTLSITDRATERYGKYNDGCWYAYSEYGFSNMSCDNYADFGELEQQEWKVHFSWGDIYGSAYCSAKSGSHNNEQWDIAESFSTYDELESASGDKKYCWCQATGYKPIGESTIYGPKSVSAGATWGYSSGESNVYWCRRYCVRLCLRGMFGVTNFRRALFVGIGE